MKLLPKFTLIFFICSWWPFESLTLALEKSRIFERILDTEVKGDLLEYLLFTDLSLQAEEDSKKSETKLSIITQELDTFKQLYEMNVGLIKSGAISLDTFEASELAFKNSELAMRVAEATHRENLAFAEVWNTRALWLKIGQPTDREFLRNSYIQLWQARCQHRVASQDLMLNEATYARRHYDRVRRLNQREAISDEEFIRLSLKLTAAEEGYKLAAYLNEECDESIKALPTKT